MSHKKPQQRLLRFVSAIAFRISPPVTTAITHRSEQTKDGRRAVTALKASLLLANLIIIHTKVKFGETLFFSLFLPILKNYVLRQVVGLCKYGHI